MPFACRVKGVKADMTRPELKRVFDYWFKTVRHVVGTDEKECFLEFCLAYKKARWHGGFSWEEQAKLADGDPFPAQLEGYDEADQRLIKTLIRVQRHSGDDWFYLSCEDAAKVMGVKSKQTAWMTLNVLCLDGVLEKVEVGAKREKGVRGKASKFRCRIVPADTNNPM